MVNQWLSILQRSPDSWLSCGAKRLASLWVGFAFTAAASAQAPRPQSPVEEPTTYTLGQILARQEENWGRLKTVEFQVVRIRPAAEVGSPGGVTVPASPTPDFSVRPSAQPRPAIGTVPTPQLSTLVGTVPPHGSEKPPTAATDTRLIPTADPLPNARELLIVGMADMEIPRTVSLFLADGANQVFRRRGGVIPWDNRTSAVITDGQLAQKVLFRPTSANDALQSNQPPLVETTGLAPHPGGGQPLAPAPALVQAGFHPRHLTDLPWLTQAHQQGQPIAISRISLRSTNESRIRVTLTQGPQTLYALLDEAAGFLPDETGVIENGRLLERSLMMLREVKGVWLGARKNVQRPGGVLEHWYYERYLANEPLPRRGVSVEFLRLPSGTDIPAWLRPELPTIEFIDRTSERNRP